tara:strand:+ start:742 stop:1095 length:354 start_codon:yes stop_codon:yes gene_type:complete
MIKSTIAALAASPLLLSGAAFAGPYVNVEVNSSLTGTDYTSTTTDLAIGWEGQNWFVQGGPIVTAADGGTSNTDFLGKVGGNVAFNEKVGVYGEFSVQTKETTDNAYGVKLGTKYTF